MFWDLFKTKSKRSTRKKTKAKHATKHATHTKRATKHKKHKARRKAAQLTSFYVLE